MNASFEGYLTFFDYLISFLMKLCMLTQIVSERDKHTAMGVGEREENA